MQCNNLKCLLSSEANLNLVPGRSPISIPKTSVDIRSLKSKISDKLSSMTFFF